MSGLARRATRGVRCAGPSPPPPLANARRRAHPRFHVERGTRASRWSSPLLRAGARRSGTAPAPLPLGTRAATHGSPVHGITGTANAHERGDVLLVRVPRGTRAATAHAFAKSATPAPPRMRRRPVAPRSTWNGVPPRLTGPRPHRARQGSRMEACPVASGSTWNGARARRPRRLHEGTYLRARRTRGRHRPPHHRVPCSTSANNDDHAPSRSTWNASCPTRAAHSMRTHPTAHRPLADVGSAAPR